MSTDNMPAQPTTTQLEAVPPWAVKLTEKVVGGFSAMEARLDSQDTKLDKAITEGIEANVRLDRVETRLGKAEGRLDIFEERVGRTSVGVRGLSQVDMEHEAKLANALTDLAEEKAKREALEKNSATKEDIAKALEEATTAQTKAILGAVDAFAQKPGVKKLTGAIVPVLMIAIAVIGLKLQASLSRLQTPPQQQQSTVVQLAPAPVPSDAGADR
jgi:hypothetical protein